MPATDLVIRPLNAYRSPICLPFGGRTLLTVGRRVGRNIRHHGSNYSMAERISKYLGFHHHLLGVKLVGEDEGVKGEKD